MNSVMTDSADAVNYSGRGHLSTPHTPDNAPLSIVSLLNECAVVALLLRRWEAEDRWTAKMQKERRPVGIASKY